MVTWLHRYPPGSETSEQQKVRIIGGRPKKKQKHQTKTEPPTLGAFGTAPSGNARSLNQHSHMPLPFFSKPPHHSPNEPARTTPAPAAMSSAFVSKSRRVRFELRLRVIDLNNVPLVSGTSFIKWHLPSSTAAEHRGRTNKCAIREHRVAYEYEKTVAVRLTVGKDGQLQECCVNFEILQEYSAGGRGERIRLGDVKLNLAEYVEASETPASPGGGTNNEASGAEGVVRRYLMQDSKINSTLKLAIHMRHIDGTRDYYAPPLRTAPVFGGIAGIIQSGEPTAAQLAQDTSDAQEAQPPANLSSTNKEAGEMQDMYRRTLAAFWASQPGELKADDAVEDIFKGGDGWGTSAGVRGEHIRDGRQNGGAVSSRPGSGATTPNLMESDAQSRSREMRSQMGQSGRGMMNLGRGGGRDRHGPGHGHGDGNHQHAKRRGQQDRPKGQGEVDEFDVRDDLKSWRVDDL